MEFPAKQASDPSS